MTTNDIEVCAAIAYENWPNESRVSRHILHELHNHDIFFLVAEIDGQIVGWAAWCWSRISYDIAEFVWCNIKSEYQRQGIGRALTQTRIMAVKSMEGKAILLTTGKPIVYEKYGFKTVGIYPLWIGDETHLMVKELG